MRYTFLIILILSVNAAVSQDSLRWYSAKLKSLTYTIIDDNDKVRGRVEFTVERIDSSNKPALSLFGKAIAYASRSQGYGSDKFTDIYQIKVDTNGFYIDYGILRNSSSSSFRSTEVINVKSNALLFYPKNPQIGQIIPSGIKVKSHYYSEQSGFGDPAKRQPFSPGDNNNLETDRTSYTRVDERKVIAKESKTIMGKRLQTYVIQHTISAAFKEDGNYKEGGYMKEWYNINAGVVAFSVYTKKDKLILSGVLTSVGY
jgi:hypothetical protein